MIQQLFTTLTDAVNGTPVVAVGAAFLWGVLSILLSPCHLASIPLVVGFITGQEVVSTRRAFVISLLFAVGILTTIGAVGAVTAVAGRMMGDVGRFGNYFVAGIFFLVGLYLLDVFSFGWCGPRADAVKGKGALGAFILGLLFGIALGPCTFAYMAPMLAVTFKLASTNLVYGMVLLAFYGAGHCSVIVCGGTSAKLVQGYMNWTEKSKATPIVKKLCGLAVIAAGLYLIWSGH